SFGILFKPPGAQNPVAMFGGLNAGKRREKLPEGAGRDGDIVFRNLCGERACVSLQAHVKDLEEDAFPIEASITGLGGT
ncbi:hypothetical protein, partial [Enterobacter hormaechei]